MRFVLFIAFVMFLGWALDNIVSPWLDLKVLERRMRRELEQRRRLRQIMEPDCICVWFDHDTLIRDPHCQASDHGGMARTLDYVRRSIQSRVLYPFKNRKE